MEFHNIAEDKVIAQVDELFREIEKNSKDNKFCICDKCKKDVICYTLNRVTPHYILSSRGASRVQNENFEHQQQSADIVALIHDGLKKVSHSMRPNFSHDSRHDNEDRGSGEAVYNVPTIIGRIFNGDNFAPISDAVVELLWENKLVPMKDGNWQNPYRVISKNEGNFSFWPFADAASGPDKHKIFDYTLRIASSGFETLTHFFKIPVASEIRTAGSFTLSRTFKLPDLYLFPPGEAEKNGYLD